MFESRLKNKPMEICNEKNAKHICYHNLPGYYYNIMRIKNGSLCIIENIVIDPSKSKQSGYIYKGPVDRKQFGNPILEKGFINSQCTPNKSDYEFNSYYKMYADSWNYDYNIENENEKLEELAPGKVVFIMSRNQNSPNIFHGSSEIINVISMFYLFNLRPEDVKVIFLESVARSIFGYI